VYVAYVHGSVLLRHVYDSPLLSASPIAGKDFSSALKVHYRPGKGMRVHIAGEVCYLRLPCLNCAMIFGLHAYKQIHTQIFELVMIFGRVIVEVVYPATFYNPSCIYSVHDMILAWLTALCNGNVFQSAS